MKTVEDHIAFVNEQSAFHRRQAERYANDRRRNSAHAATAESFDELANFLTEKAQDKGQASEVDGINLSWSEIKQVPEELLAELSVTESDRFDFSIVELIDKCGGVASLDRILVELYKSTSEVYKRTALNARLYRLSQKGLLFTLPGKKGVYSTSANTTQGVDNDTVQNNVE